MSVDLKERGEAIAKAEKKLLWEDDHTRITFWRFPPGTETGWHRHTHNYVTLQQSGGQLKLEARDGTAKIIDYVDGQAAAYSAPIEHNATNISDVEVQVTEIEYKTTGG